MSYPNLTAETIQTLTTFFNFVDTNNDGFVSIAEIIAACQVDVDDNGVITQEEIDSTAGPWIATLHLNQDLNHDDLLSLNELLQYNNDF